MMNERGLNIVGSMVYRWVQHYSPELQKKASSFIKSYSDSWKIDETYVKVKGEWLYLYRAIDSRGQTIDFYLSRTRNHKAVRLILRKLINKQNITEPRVVNVDANPAYPKAFVALKKESKLANTILGTKKYLNNLIEQDNRRVKWKNKDSLGHHSYKTAYNTIRGVETMHMFFKKQLYQSLLKTSKTSSKGNLVYLLQFF